MVLVVLVSAVAGGVVLGGTATAFDGKAAATYPSTPGSSTLGTTLAAVKPGDNAPQNGIKQIRLDFSGSNFDGSVENISASDVFVVIRGGQRIEIANSGGSIIDVSGIRVSSNGAGDQLTITLPRPITPQFPDGGGSSTGAEVAVKFDNFTTPSQPGSYTVEQTLIGPSGGTDGPVSLTYGVSSPELSMSNQSISQFSDTQEVNVSAQIPGGRSYIGVFTVAQNGSPDELVGSTNVSDGEAQDYSIDVSGNVSESQELVAVAYTESEGRSAGLREDESFDPTQDDPLVVNGNLVNASASISTLDVDSRVEAGNEYDQGAQLYFSQGDSATSYQIRTVQNGELGPSATQFQTAQNGTAVVDTTGLEEGQYAISRVDDNSLVSLDNDSTTNPGDDSFFVTGQQMTTTGADTGGSTTTDGSGAQTATDGGEGDATEGSGDSGGDEATATGGSGGDGNGGSNGGGPGFGPVVAVVALLAAALLAVRRNR